MKTRIILLCILIMTSFTAACSGGTENNETIKNEQQKTECIICQSTDHTEHPECENCGSTEHTKDDCTITQNTDAKCTFCGKAGHIIAECPHLNA